MRQPLETFGTTVWPIVLKFAQLFHLELTTPFLETQSVAELITLEAPPFLTQSLTVHTLQVLVEQLVENIAMRIVQLDLLLATLQTIIHFWDLLLLKVLDLQHVRTFAQLFTLLDQLIRVLTLPETLWLADFTTAKSPFLLEI